MSELVYLIEQEIPQGRQGLQENFSNLEKVAQYCQENYVQAKDKKKALEETKSYTTHSLAHVAYQINNLATNFLKLLDLQQSQLAEMESNVNHLAQTVNIHKEKVARREIGVLTTNKSTTRPLGVKNGIIFPEQGEKPTKYHRKNIDYTILDDIGHGVKTSTPGSSSSSGSVRRTSETISGGMTPAPTQQPPTPPQMKGSLGRAAGHIPGATYRTPAPVVAPPTVPNNYASLRDLQQQKPAQPQNEPSAYAPSTPPINMGPFQYPPRMYYGGQSGSNLPVGQVRPISHGMPPPPLPPPDMMPGERIIQMPREFIENLPPPPMIVEKEIVDIDLDYPGSPLPPPQFVDDGMFPDDDNPYAGTGPELFTANIIPEHYLEKVIAIYDYQADKEDELSFTENSVIYVVRKNDDGWYEGMLNGQTGLFPGNYVEPCI